jgi:hypothetical protein
MSNDRAYIHEFIDIRGARRADYMHHMTANWSPNAQEERDQFCFGVWGVLGSTGHWPQVCNIWEEAGLDGLASSFAGEAIGAGIQDPKLEKWWNAAAEFRRGGVDRILLPAPWMPTISDSLADGVRAEVFAHEILRCAPGAAHQLLELAGDSAAGALGSFGWRLVGAWSTAMRDDDEVVLLWAIPDWATWALVETAQATDDGIVAWRTEARSTVSEWRRILLVAAPLCPFRTGRQPTRDDRVDWVE